MSDFREPRRLTHRWERKRAFFAPQDDGSGRRRRTASWWRWSMLFCALGSFACAYDSAIRAYDSGVFDCTRCLLGCAARYPADSDALDECKAGCPCKVNLASYACTDLIGPVSSQEIVEVIGRAEDIERKRMAHAESFSTEVAALLEVYFTTPWSDAARAEVADWYVVTVLIEETVRSWGSERGTPAQALIRETVSTLAIEDALDRASLIGRIGVLSLAYLEFGELEELQDLVVRYDVAEEVEALKAAIIEASLAWDDLNAGPGACMPRVAGAEESGE